MNIKHDYIDQIYKERNKFIIIGLTGRTGSCCSTIANLFASEFDELLLILRIMLTMQRLIELLKKLKEMVN